MRPTIDASHLGTTIAAQVCASQEAALLARERALRPEPAMATSKATTTPKPKVAKRPPSRARVAGRAHEAKPTPKPKAVPPGWMLLDPPTSRAVRRLIETHPETKGL